MPLRTRASLRRAARVDVGYGGCEAERGPHVLETGNTRPAACSTAVSHPVSPPAAPLSYLVNASCYVATSPRPSRPLSACRSRV